MGCYPPSRRMEAQRAERGPRPRELGSMLDWMGSGPPHPEGNAGCPPVTGGPGNEGGMSEQPWVLEGSPISLPTALL